MCVLQLTAEKIAVDVAAIGCSDDGAVNSLCEGYVLRSWLICIKSQVNAMHLVYLSEV